MTPVVEAVHDMETIRSATFDAKVSSFEPTTDNTWAYRDALGQFATGVTVVTINTPLGPVGMTVNSFASVSLEPALVLWSLEKTSGRSRPFLAAQHYAIHVLRKEQSELALKFARDADAFDSCNWEIGANDVPLIRDALACFECQIEAQHDAGDHVIIVGRVSRATKKDGSPLVFASGELGGFERP